MSIWKNEALQKYKEECFKQTRPYQYEVAYVNNAGGVSKGNPPTSTSGTIINFPEEDKNILNFEGINTEYIVFVDREGVLEKNAIQRMLTLGKGADVIYCDEDFITDVTDNIEDMNVRIRTLRTPYRKPDYSPDTLVAFPYIETCFAIRTAFARMVPALKKSPEISDNVRVWDFLLRAIERTNRVFHVKEILYHRDLASLISPREEAISDEDIYKALMDRYKKPGYMLCKEAASMRWEMGVLPVADKDLPLVSIIIPSKDNPDLLKECIRNIRLNAGNVKYEIIIVDNGSKDDNRHKIEESVKKLPEKMAVYIYDEFEFDFSRMCNIGANEAKGKYFLFLNDDVDAIEPKFLEKLLSYAHLPHVGAVGAKLLYPDGKGIQHVGITNINKGPTHKLMTLSDEKVHYFGRNYYAFNVLAVTGACLMIAREKYFQVGGFSDKMKVTYNDVDLCVKLIENGYFNVVNNECCLIHHESISRGLDKEDEAKRLRLKTERRYFFEAHPWLKQNSDPFFNPYLDMDTIEIKSGVVADYQITDYRNKVKSLNKIPGRLSKHAFSSIDRCFFEEGIDEGVEAAYVFDGWGLIDKKDNALYKRYLLLIPLNEDGVEEESCIISTVSPKYRTDIKEVFPDAANTLLAGFECRIPVSMLDDNKRYRMAVCLKKLGGIGKTTLTLGEIYEPGRGIITEN